MDPELETPAVIDFGRFRVVPYRRELLADGRPVELGARAFDVLMALIEVRGAVITKDALMERVWPNRIVEENSLQAQISVLRKVFAADRDLIAHHVDRVIIKPQSVEVHLTSRPAESPESHADEPAAGEPVAATLMLTWAAPAFAAVKGVIHQPVVRPAMSPETRAALLTAIARARGWIEDLRLGRTATLAEIAEREGMGERHVRLLAPLAFAAPRIIAMIAGGAAPADLTVTGLAKGLPYSWAAQERGLLSSA